LLRLFVGVDVPYNAELDALMRLVKSSGADIKPVEPENMHITLLFIGEVDERALTDVKQAVSSVSFPKFALRLAGLGAFPNPFRPRVVWVGVREGVEELRSIHEQLRRNLIARGVRPEDEKEFSPHLTLGRVKGAVGTLPQLIVKYQDYEVGTKEVSSIKLFKSTLTPKGPIYEVLMEVKASDRGRGAEKDKANSG
jgi:2'-5' RNA ligase